MIAIKLIAAILVASIALANGQSRSRRNNCNFQVAQNLKTLVTTAETNHGARIYRNLNRPEITYTTEKIGGVEVLRSMRATLTSATIPRSNSRGSASFPKAASDNRMLELNNITDDEKGHILAYSLGGPFEMFNLVPQNKIVNRSAGTTADRFSSWRDTEDLILGLVRDTRYTLVDWEVYIFYDETQININKRPCGFGLRYTAPSAGAGVANFNSGDITFDN